MLTVGIPAFNAGKTLEAAIASILRQTWRGTLEVLVVDDGSTDDTVAVATRLSERYGAVRVVRHDRNRGRPTARNTVLREATGHYLTWMDADDEWYPHKLAVQFDHLLSQPPSPVPVICMCAFDWQWEHSNKPSHRVPDIGGDQLKGLLRGKIGAYLWTMLGTLEAFRDVGEFDERLPRLQDLDFTIRFVARGGRLVISDPRVPLCLYHKSDEDKPGRVIAESMSHIWRKHRPLFAQYGRRFGNGARRQHFLLAARHGFKNEGRWTGYWYSLRAAACTPGLIVAPLMGLLGRRPAGQDSAGTKLETQRENWKDAMAVPRNTGGPSRIDIVVSCAGQADEPTRAWFRSFGHAQRAAGVWYLPPGVAAAGRNVRDHAPLLSLLDGDRQAALASLQRLGRMAAISNSDGRACLMYLGAPVRMDIDAPGRLAESVADLAAKLESMAEVLRPEVPQVHLHLLVPDSETLLWRRYFDAIESRRARGFEGWLQSQPDGLVQALDHRCLKPLLELQGLSSILVHLLTETSAVDELRQQLGTSIGSTAGLAPSPAPTVRLGLPARNPGLPYFERLLGTYLPLIGADAAAAARSRVWALDGRDADNMRSSNAESCVRWLDARGRWTPYSQRFSPAQLVHGVPESELRASPDAFRFPIDSPEAYERCLSEYRGLRLLAEPL